MLLQFTKIMTSSEFTDAYLGERKRVRRGSNWRRGHKKANVELGEEEREFA